MENELIVTDQYRVDGFDSVYDEEGVFYCKWSALTKEEKKLVKKNPASSR